MTENEAIEWLKAISATQSNSLNKNSLADRKEALHMAIVAFEELEQYRAIGTVERFQQLSEQFKPHLIDETFCPERHCNKCDKYRKENEKYHEIGTVEECWKVMEKQRAKKVSNIKYLRDFNGDLYDVKGGCPNCKSNLLLSINRKHCSDCGQKLDWN